MDVQEEMTQRGKIEPEVSIHLRPVIESDLPILFEYQREPEAMKWQGFRPGTMTLSWRIGQRF